MIVQLQTHDGLSDTHHYRFGIIIEGRVYFEQGQFHEHYYDRFNRICKIW